MEPVVPVVYEERGAVAVVTLNRPARRNAVDGPTATLLDAAFTRFSASSAHVAVLTGAGGHFCAGADLKAFAADEPRPLLADGPGPMGPTRMVCPKPVIAAIEGFAVAGGLELALWCDLRVAASDATLGVFCRRFGVPLIDLGTVRLPRLIGHSRALDLILTGRAVVADEALAMGLVNRVVAPGQALDAAIALADEIAAFPQVCLQNDRRSAYEQWDLEYEAAWKNEFAHGVDTLRSGESRDGAQRFSGGAGRHEKF